MTHRTAVITILRSRGTRATASGAALVGVLALTLHDRATIGRAAAALPHARPAWSLLAVLASAATVATSAMAVRAAAGNRLPLRRTMAVELAGSFANRLLPAGMGRNVLLARYLARRGVAVERAVAVLSLLSLAGAVAHAAAAVIATLAAGGRPSHLAPPVPPTVLAIGVAAVAVGVVIAASAVGGETRSRLVQRGRRLLAEVRLLAASPRQSVTAVAMSALTSLAYVGCFIAATRAAGVNVPIAATAAAYLLGSAAANAVPTPGGVGAAEAALTTGLVLAGAPAAPAFAAVLIYRLATYWAPTALGAASFLALRRGALTTSEMARAKRLQSRGDARQTAHRPAMA